MTKTGLRPTQERENIFMTKREFLNAVIADENVTEEIRNYAQVELDKMDAANEKRRNKVSKTQKANIEAGQEIAAHLTAEPWTATDIAVNFGLASPQKAHAVMRTAVEAGLAEKVDTKVDGRTVKGYIAPQERIEDEVENDVEAE